MPGNASGELNGRTNVQTPAMTTVTSETEISDLDIGYEKEVGEAMLEEAKQTEFSPEMEEIVRGNGVLGDRRFFT